MRASGGRKIRTVLKIVAGVICVLMVFTAFGAVLLRHGLELEKVGIEGLQAEQVRLVWQKKLQLTIKKLNASGYQEKSEVAEKDHYNNISPKLVSYILPLFSLIDIKEVIFGNQRGWVSLHEKQTRIYSLEGSFDEMLLHSQIQVTPVALELKNFEIDDKSHHIQAAGQMSIDSEQLTVTGTAICNFGEVFPVRVSFKANQQGLHFQGSEAGEITDIQPLVSLFGLDHGIEQWITEFLKGSRFNLISFAGDFPWSAPITLLDTLKAKVRVDNTEYTFAPGLKPIKAVYTDVTFSRGILEIKPHDPTFYGHDGGNSWLKIDFNDPENILLTAYILTTTNADSDIERLLNYYHIPFPIIQDKGNTAVDLTLAINLNKILVDVEATFSLLDSVITYDGISYHVNDAELRLKNAELTIDRLTYMAAADLLRADVSGFMDFARHKGIADIVPQKMNIPLGTSLIQLDPSRELPRIRYHIESDKHWLEVGESYFVLDALPLSVGAFEAPLDVGKLSVSLSQLHIQSPVGFGVAVSGSIGIKQLDYDLTWNLYRLKIRDLELETTPYPIAVRYNGKMEIETESIAHLKLNQVALKLHPSKFLYGDNHFETLESRVSYGTFFDSSFKGFYNLHEKKGEFRLLNIDITDENLEQDLRVDGQTRVDIVGRDNTFELNFPEIALKVTSDENRNWSAMFTDLSKAYPRSQFLQKMGIKDGSLRITSKDGKMPYFFVASFTPPHPVLVKNNELLERWVIDGRFGENGLSASIGEVDIMYYHGQLKLFSHGTGYNIPALTSLAEDLEELSTGGMKSNSVGISLNAEDSFLLLRPKSRLLADNIDLHYEDGIFTATLRHGDGQLLFQATGEAFRAGGRDFGDSFMGALIHESTFTGGNMSFTAAGSFDEFSAVFEIKNSVIKDLKTLNNVMAMVNTVPALITFSLPEYSSNGLRLDSAVVGLHYNDKVCTIESVEVKSPELQAVGKGEVDFLTNQLDLNLKLTTQARRNIRKLPLVGYVMAGEEKDPSISLKVKGDLKNPDVEYGLFREIITIPYEVLYRTLRLPVHLFESLAETEEE